MRILLALFSAGALVACGADGEPVQPQVNSTVTLSSSGVHAGTNLGLRQGPFAVSLGLGL
ncbi:hypothetical protein A8B82_07290 [Sulfitobacter sp. EhC04]|uniref:hypothetical protein n=1 Tax=Sulfitobacter sp. EhC04 TaxID=1849168 RepID=UPI0007F51CA3|nr:hypothetical protein [Sulfitobacter sp. EhC04]OAN80028.1 hypothetical protein A8B82_07290 [Sulfitobacter sp. EhC04]